MALGVALGFAEAAFGFGATETVLDVMVVGFGFADLRGAIVERDE